MSGAREVIDVMILNLKTCGPSPEGYQVKTLRRMEGLWQINLKVKKRQIRILYAPYVRTIVLFRIHKKNSPPDASIQLGKDKEA